MISSQVAPVDRLVMRDPVPEEVKTLDTIFHIGPDPVRVIRRSVLSKRRGKRRYPQRSQVPVTAQESPEPESKFRDDPAVELGLSSPCCALTSIGDDLPHLRRLSTKEMPLPVPGPLPSFGRAESNERTVHRIAE